jgi:hypothetical protein
MPKRSLVRQYQIRAYWYNRSQTAQECAIQLIEFVQNIEQLGLPFINWVYLNPKDKSIPVPFDLDEFRLKVLEPVNGLRRGVVKAEEMMSALGFAVLLFSQGKGAEMVKIFGMYGIDDRDSANHNIIELPRAAEIATPILQVDILKSLLELVVRQWNPDWAVIDYFDAKDPERDVDRIPVYWFVYLPERRGQIPSLPAPSEVVRIEGYGSYAIVTPEPFIREREDHLEIASTVRGILDEAGLLVKRPE